MADPIVRNRPAGESGPGDSGSGDSGPGESGPGESVPGDGDSRDGGEPDAPADRRAAARGSLFGPTPGAAGDAPPYGHLGPPLSRSSAFHKGFFGALGVLVATGIVLALRDASSVLTLVVIAVFLAVGLNPLVEFGIRRGLRRGWAVLVVSLLGLAFLALVLVVVGGVLRNQLVTFVNDAPHLLDGLRKHHSIAQLDRRYHVIADLQNKLRDPNFIDDYLGGVFNVGVSVFNAVAGTVVVLILTAYFLGALPSLKRALYSVAPASRRERVGQLGDAILRRVGRYVIGAFMVALLAGTVTLVFLLSIGLGQYALPLAVMVALLDLVPLVGSILGAATVSVVGLANSLPLGIACIVFYLVYELLEGYVIYPRVMRSSVDVPEYVTIIAVLLGGAVDGIVGALLALPIGAALLLLLREVWVRRQDIS